MKRKLVFSLSAIAILSIGVYGVTANRQGGDVKSTKEIVLDSVERESALLSDDDNEVVAYSLQNTVSTTQELESVKSTRVASKNPVHAVYNAILAIPEEITEDNLEEAEEAVAKAEEAYNCLTEEQKKQISSSEYSIIEISKFQIEQLKNSIKSEKSFRAVSKSPVHTVYNAIFAIPEEITKDNLEEAEKAVVKAEEAYASLSAEEKKQISSSEYSIIERSRFQVDQLKEIIKSEKSL